MYSRKYGVIIWAYYTRNEEDVLPDAVQWKGLLTHQPCLLILALLVGGWELQSDTRSPTFNSSPSGYVRKLLIETIATWEIYRLLSKPEGWHRSNCLGNTDSLSAGIARGLAWLWA
jgi:hypothetical protein